jgi:hypothetical protein
VAKHGKTPTSDVNIGDGEASDEPEASIAPADRQDLREARGRPDPLAGCRSWRGGVTGRYREPTVCGLRTEIRAAAARSSRLPANVSGSRVAPTPPAGCRAAAVSGVRVRV